MEFPSLLHPRRAPPLAADARRGKPHRPLGGESPVEVHRARDRHPAAIDRVLILVGAQLRACEVELPADLSPRQVNGARSLEPGRELNGQAHAQAVRDKRNSRAIDAQLAPGTDKRAADAAPRQHYRASDNRFPDLKISGDLQAVT
jgi:hypothetical protein